MAAFEAKNLSFTYPLTKKTALENISFSINDGEAVLIMGASAAGKSTLLRLLKKEIAPVGEMQGSLCVNTPSIAFVSQNPDNTFVAESVRGELAFALENRALSNDEITVKIGETASFFNLCDVLDRKLETLSGGEKSAVAIAASVIAGCDALLLDEPLSQLDVKSTLSVCALLRRINEELGVTVITVSHSAENIIDFCDRIILLDKGKIICNEPPQSAVRIESFFPFLPVCARMFEERPLTVKQALPLAAGLKEKELEALSFDKNDVCVSLKNISFRYGRDLDDVLKRLDYKAYSGKINCIIGANASGKTTLLKIIAEIRKPYCGKVKVKMKTAYMPQNVKYLFTKDSVKDEISEKTAQKLGIADCLESHPYDISGGQAQKLALGILLEQNADIFLLDEPTKAFDELAKKEFKAILKSLCEQGKTIIMVSHDLDFAGEAADCVSFLSDGIISRAGGRREVFSSLDFYTTQVRRITKKQLNFAVSEEDIV